MFQCLLSAGKGRKIAGNSAAGSEQGPFQAKGKKRTEAANGRKEKVAWLKALAERGMKAASTREKIFSPDSFRLGPSKGILLGVDHVNPALGRASTRVMVIEIATRTDDTLLVDERAEEAVEAVTEEFSQIMLTYRPRVYRFLLASTRDLDLAETLAQECFLKAYRSWTSFRGESSVMTWLLRIAINLEKDHWRNRRLQFWRQVRGNTVDVDEASEWLPSSESSAERRMLAREQVKQVWRVVDKLSARQKMVFLLRVVEEMELSEIAGATGLSEGTVKTHLSRALNKVRAGLKGTR
jgi:RNA polymerase sigma-70 factor (ECF subfamily)